MDPHALTHDLALFLDLLERGSWGFQFRVMAVNRSAVRLLLPFPDITDLRFLAEGTVKEAEWYTGNLVSAAGGAFTLDPGGTSEFVWRVRPCDVERPDSWEDDSYRWCVDLPAGTYHAWCRWRVDAGYFAPDSHVRFPALEYWAEKEAAVAWTGTTESNRVTVIRVLGR